MNDWNTLFQSQFKKFADSQKQLDSVPFLRVCSKCGRTRPMEIPVCNYCSRAEGKDAIGTTTEG